MANLSKVIYINEVDYSTLLNGGTITKGGVTYSHDPTALYVIKNVSAPEYAETAGYATTAGQATKATQDGGGNVISETYAKKVIIGTLTNNNDVWSCDRTYSQLASAILAGDVVLLREYNLVYYPRRYPYLDNNDNITGDITFRSIGGIGNVIEVIISDDNTIEYSEYDLESEWGKYGYIHQRTVLRLTIGQNNILTFKDYNNNSVSISDAKYWLTDNNNWRDVVIQYNNREYRKQTYESNYSRITFVSIDLENYLLYYLSFNCSTSNTMTLIENTFIPILPENVDLGQAYGVSSNNSNAARTSSISGFKLKKGGIVAIKFTTDINITNPSLNISSTGAKPIYYRGSTLLRGTINAGDTVTFIYDGTYYHIISIDKDIPDPATTAPIMDGTATVGTSGKYAKEDHVHPSDTSRVSISRKINNKPLTGDITLNASDVGALPSNTHIPNDIKVGSVAGKLYRNDVNGGGNFTVKGNSGCIPNVIAGTFLVSIYAKSTTQSYTFGFNFGSVSYNLSTTNGEINDVREITIPSDGTFSGSVLNGSVASGTILYVVMYNYLTPVSTVGVAAVTNRYSDLDGTPTIPTVNNGTLTIQKNGTTVQTFTANQSSSVIANITVPTTASDIDAVPTIISTTYNDLVTVVTNSQLIEGAWYRITDYVCTTAQTDTYSAGHQFDILVQAVSPNKLSEDARATRHEGDTYFANSNLEAWKIWYCLDNDVTRFAWAEPAEGKGVIYRMIDEWGNDCPYDFKNIQFKRYQLKNQDYLYASKALWDNDGDTYGNEAIINFHNTFAILYNNLGTSINRNTIPFYYTRGIHDEYYIVDESELYGYDEVYETYRDNSGNTIALSKSGARKFVAVYNSLYDYYDIILEVNDTDGEWMYTFSRKNGINTPSIDNSLSGKIYNNKFTNSGTLYDNVFISYNIDLIVQNNTFGNDCESNTFGNYCTLNTFGIDCDLNTFGNSCYNNSFGNNCDSNIFGIDCKLNTFGNSCYNNFLGNNVHRNTFGNYVYSNTFGNSCNNNSFGNNVHRNTFGNGCDSNTFGNDCDSNIFGKGCDSNTFGNAVDHVTFSKDYTSYVIVENGNQYITLTSTETTSSSNLLRNITIAQGVNNTSTTKTISHNTLNDAFRTTYTVDDNGDIYAITPTKYSEWDNKQSTLVSGTNIKTINNQSLVGSGNLTLSDVGADIFVVNIESDDNDVYTCDKTNAEIYAAWQAGRNIVLIRSGDYLYKLNEKPNQIICDFSGDDNDDINSYRQYTIFTSNGQQRVIEDFVRFQECLHSGTNIKTINNQSLLGSGNLTPSDIGADAFIVNITYSNGTHISDKTYSQITTAYNSKRNIFAVYDGAVYQLIQINDYGIRFVNFSQMDVEDRMDVIFINASDSISYDEIYYQRALISGTNIKTINGKSILGSGNVTVQGEQGPAGTIAIGSVSSGTSASVTNSGTASSAVLDFVLPKGAKGDKGDKGDTGASGVHVGDTMIEQTTGSSTTSLMSQKAVTDAIDELDKMMPTSISGSDIISYNVADYPLLNPALSDGITVIYDKRVIGSYDFYKLLTLESLDQRNYFRIDINGWQYKIVTKINGGSENTQTLNPGAAAINGNKVFIATTINFKTGEIKFYSDGVYMSTVSFNTSKLPDFELVERVKMSSNGNKIRFLGVCSAILTDEQNKSIYSNYPNDVFTDEHTSLMFGVNEIDLGTGSSVMNGVTCTYYSNYIDVFTTSNSFSNCYVIGKRNYITGDDAKRNIIYRMHITVTEGTPHLIGIGINGRHKCTVYDSNGDVVSSAGGCDLSVGEYDLEFVGRVLSNYYVINFSRTGVCKFRVSDVTVQHCGAALILSPYNLRGNKFVQPNGDEIEGTSSLEVFYDIYKPEIVFSGDAPAYNGQIKCEGGHVYFGYVTDGLNVWKRLDN